MKDLLGAIFLLELIARIVGPPKHGPYLVSLTASEPMPPFEDGLYRAAYPETSDYQ